MMPEIGNYLICLTAAIAILMGILPFVGRYHRMQESVRLQRILAVLLLLCIVSSFGILIYALINNDFTVSYVAQNSNLSLPLRYKIAAAWGAHEGSLLLWNVLLGGWTSAVALFSTRLSSAQTSRMLAVLGMINAGFLLFIILTSNPFLRTLPNFPVDGKELNPLLQDPGLIFHPPLLYMGYVGFAVPFAFAIASLLQEQQEAVWVRWIRPWVQAAWGFLTLGIVLGSVWAYYELGWGGWWFWDPVENASLMPWLAGTALLHSLSVTEQRRAFQLWTIFLSIAVFTLSLLGTFLVRSGILISVHTFASDPKRGMAILLFITIVAGSSLTLFALRGARLKGNSRFSLWSRETLLAGNNLLLTTALTVVILGTLLPLIHKLLGLGTISVGAPFFNLMFTVLVIPLGILLGAGPLVRWGRDTGQQNIPLFIVCFLFSLTGAILLPWLWQGKVSVLSIVGIYISLWIFLLTIAALGRVICLQGRITPAMLGMYIGHAGVAVVIMGITFSQNYSVERNVRLEPGHKVVINGFEFILRDERSLSGPNYDAERVRIDVMRNNNLLDILNPQKRLYHNSRMVMTEAAIKQTFTYDLYAALGEKQSDGSWTLRLYYKPMQHWIWWGGIIMALAVLICMLDPRYRRAVVEKDDN